MARRPRVTPGIPLVLDKERLLYFDIGYLMLAELELGRVYGKKVSLFQVIGSGDGLGLNDIHILLWAALLDDDPSLTLLRVQDLMDLNRIADYTTAIFAAWNVAWPTPDPQEEGTTDPLAPGSTGDASGVPPGSSLVSLTPSSGN